MAKTVDLKAAKEAKQKKIAIAGTVLLVLILALSVPRTLKMLNHKAPTSAASQTTTQPTPAVTPTTPLPATAAPASGTPVSQVLSAPLEAAAHNGQLARLSPTFTSKDPFVQQMQLDGSSDGANGSSAGSDATKQSKKKAPPSPSGLSKASAQPAPAPSTPATSPSPSATSPSGPAPSSGPAPTAPSSPAPPAQSYVSATISIDGVPEGVNVKADFPAASPVFHLVSATKKTAVITIAGGSLANGDPTLTLHVGRAVTLVNTADGTRYKLVLVSTSTAPAVPQSETPAGASAPGATTPATTAPTTTTATQTTGG